MGTIRIFSAAIFLGALSLLSAQTPTEVPDLDLWNHGAVFTTAEESTGDLLIGGLFALAGGLPRDNIGRLLLPESEFDPDFAPVVDGPVFVMLPEASGKILVGGSFSRVNGTVRNNVARLNSDGSLDTDWNPGSNAPVFVLEFDGPDHIIVGGTFSQIDGQTRRGLARLALADGQVDSSWNPDVRGGGVFALARGASDFWIGGNFNEVGGQPAQSLARLDASGLLVTAHDVDGNVESLSFDPEQGLYFCGRFSTVDGQQRSRLGRLGLDGILDSFSIAVDQNVNDCRGADGQVLIGGQFVSVNGMPAKGVARLSASGVLDADFQPALGGVFAGTAGTDVLVWTARELNNDRVFVGGVFRHVNSAPRAGAALLDSLTGEPLDPIDVEQPGEVRTILTLEDGGLLVGGRFWRSGNELRDNFARVQSDGNLDPQWTLSINGEVLSGALLDDGSAVLGGFFSSANQVPRNNLVLVTLNGTPEVVNGWNPGADGPVLVIQQDQLDPDQLYVAGAFSEIQGSQTYQRGAMARLSLIDSGTPDDFDPGFNAQVNDMLQIPSTSRVYVAGVFNQAGGQSRRGIAAFIDIGGQMELDTNFDAAANGNLWVLNAAPDGQSFYAGGEFTTLFGETRMRLAKIGPGSEQWTPSIPTGTPVAMALDGDGGLFVGGNFLNLNGAPRARLARLDADNGALDDTFNPGAEPGIVWEFSIDPDQLFIAGSFQQTAGLPRSGLAAFQVDLIFSDGFESSASVRGGAELIRTNETSCDSEINLAGRGSGSNFIRAPGCN